MADDSGDDSIYRSSNCQWKKKPKVIILGAGIAGISAGSHLAKNGFTDFQILEATNRVGGRIWSIDLESAPDKKAELGANWIHGIDANPIYKIAVQNKLLNPHKGRTLGQKMMFVTDEGEPVSVKVIEEVDWHYGMLMQECEEFYQDGRPTPFENDSVGGFVERSFHEKIERYRGYDHKIRRMILEQRLLREAVISGSHSMNDVSLSEIGCFQELPGVHYVIPPGFESVVHILKKDIPTENILLEHSVRSIEWNREESSASANLNERDSHEICVECENGRRFFADIVLVTMSLGYLKKFAGRIFNPSLPEFKKSAIESIEMGTVNKVILEFEERVLPVGVFRLELMWDREGIDEEDLKNNWHKKIGSFEAVADNVLIAWLSGREAEYMEDIPETEVIEKCCGILRQFLKCELPRLSKLTRSRWKSDPYANGAYSFIPVGGHAEDIETLGEPICKQDNRPVLLFAGEATHPCFYSSSHGALLSGQREAQRILEQQQH